MNKKVVSKYSGAGAFIVTPVKDGAVLTKSDQKRLGFGIYWRRSSFAVIHFLAEKREEVLARIKAAKVSKPMKVVEITDKQWEMRFEHPETIRGTGVAATKMQLARAFEI